MRQKINYEIFKNTKILTNKIIMKIKIIFRKTLSIVWRRYFNVTYKFNNKNNFSQKREQTHIIYK